MRDGTPGPGLVTAVPGDIRAGVLAPYGTKRSAAARTAEWAAPPNPQPHDRRKPLLPITVLHYIRLIEGSVQGE
jgi:hypothetical protein